MTMSELKYLTLYSIMNISSIINSYLTFGGICKTTIDINTVLVYNLVVLSNNDLVISSIDNDIQIITVKNNKYTCKQILTGHDKAVYCVTKSSNDDIISGSWDGTLKVWSKDNNYDCIHTIHTIKCSEIYRILVFPRSQNDPSYNIISNSSDNTLIVWSIDNDCNEYLCKQILSGHSK